MDEQHGKKSEYKKEMDWDFISYKACFTIIMAMTMDIEILG